MTGARQLHTAVQLGTSGNPTTSGKVLVGGGKNGSTSLNTAQLYSPTAGTWVAATNLNAARHQHTATLLTSGKVLVTGGLNGTTTLATAATYDPSTDGGTWAATTGPLPSAVKSHTATLLTTTNQQLNNKVLLCGGNNGTSTLSFVYLYDPVQNAFSTLANMPSAREGQTATVLSNGKLLLAGGKNGSTTLNTAVLFDPGSGPGSWSTDGNMTTARQGHTASLLSNGQVLVAGGNNGSSSLSSAELYNGTSWSATTAMPAAVQAHTASTLASGIILIAGGVNGSTTQASARLYDVTGGNTCTSGSQCASGSCVSGVCCNTACTDQCYSCSLSGLVGICSPKTNGTACNDGNLCTQTDTCQSGTCTGANPIVCTALDQCHVAGTCNQSTGVCSSPNRADGTGCNDGNLCTQTDTCQSGTCTGANPVLCTALDQCHDVGTCNQSTGTCPDPNKADGTACTDNNACTASDTCQAGSCQSGTPVAIDDQNLCTSDACDSVTGVTHTPLAAGTSCSDGNACNGNEICNDSAVCIAGTPPVIDDNNPCTTDACDPMAGVTHTPATGTCCSDGNACNGNETCNASGTCQAGAAVTCEAGPCYPGGSCSLTLTTPAAYPADNIVLGAVDNIDIGSFATVSGPSAGIVALGCSGVQLGLAALATASVWSGGGVVLDYNAKVDGNVEAGSQPALYPGATITGNSVVRSGLPSLNNQRIDFTFGNCVNDVILESTQVKPIKPGQYRTVSVKANTKLQLGRGHYWFDSLSVDSGGTIEVNAPSGNPNAPPGSLTIVVRGSATLGGSTAFPLGTIDFKLLVGGSDVVLSAPFSGTVVAPNARIALTSSAAPYQGSFQGKTIFVASGVVVDFVAPTNMDELPAAVVDVADQALGIPMTAGALPSLTDPSKTSGQIVSDYLKWTANSTRSDGAAWRSAIVTMRGNSALVQAVVDAAWSAINSLDVTTGVIALDTLAALRLETSETVFETLVAQAAPSDGPTDDTGVPLKTRMFDTLQIHAVRGLGWLWLKFPGYTALRQVAVSHPRPVVQQEAIRMYVLFGGASAKADLAAALPGNLQIYIDRPESLNFEDSSFDSRLDAYLQKHPELVVTMPPVPTPDPSTTCYVAD